MDRLRIVLAGLLTAALWSVAQAGQSPFHSSVFFSSDSDVISDRQRDYIVERKSPWKAQDTRCFWIAMSGHVDSAEASQAGVLDDRRVQMVWTLMKKQGFDPSQLRRVALHGASMHIVRTPDGAAEPQNRRVDVILFPIDRSEGKFHCEGPDYPHHSRCFVTLPDGVRCRAQ